MKHLASILASVSLAVLVIFGWTEVTKPNYHSFQASTVKIEFVSTISGKVVGVCSGVYLTGDRVLTAGHCVKENYKNLLTRVTTHTGQMASLSAIRHKLEFEKFEQDGNQIRTISADIGLFKVDGAINAKPAKLTCGLPDLGDDVYAVGMPVKSQWVVTKGQVTTYHPRIFHSEGRWLQLNMTVLPGNSGGPLFDKWGQVVGITSHIVTKRGGIPLNHAYAVPAPVICDFLDTKE